MARYPQAAGYAGNEFARLYANTNNVVYDDLEQLLRRAIVLFTDRRNRHFPQPLSRHHPEIPEIL
jgi:hypothetical protein